MSTSLALSLALALLLSLTVSAGSAQAAAGDFGAIAYSPSTHTAAFGAGDSQDNAQRASVEGCRSQGGGQDCTAEVWFENGFGSLARSGDNFGTGWGTTADNAMHYAIQTCQDFGGNDCVEVYRARTSDTPDNSPSARGGPVSHPPTQPESVSSATPVNAAPPEAGTYEVNRVLYEDKAFLVMLTTIRVSSNGTMEASYFYHKFAAEPRAFMCPATVGPDDAYITLQNGQRLERIDAYCVGHPGEQLCAGPPPCSHTSTGIFPAPRDTNTAFAIQWYDMNSGAISFGALGSVRGGFLPDFDCNEPSADPLPELKQINIDVKLRADTWKLICNTLTPPGLSELTPDQYFSTTILPLIPAQLSCDAVIAILAKTAEVKSPVGGAAASYVIRAAGNIICL